MTIEFRQSLPRRDWIVLSGMSLPCVLGLHDWERRGPQALVAEVGMALDLDEAAGGDLSASVDYAAVLDQIRIHRRSRQVAAPRIHGGRHGAPPLVAARSGRGASASRLRVDQSDEARHLRRARAAQRRTVAGPRLVRSTAFDLLGPRGCDGRQSHRDSRDGRLSRVARARSRMAVARPLDSSVDCRNPQH